MKFKLIIPIICLSITSSCSTSNNTEQAQEPIKAAAVIVNTPVSEPKLELKPAPPIVLAKAPVMPEPKTEACEKRSFDNKITIDISEQQLYLYCNYDKGKQDVKTYPISTSKYGIGSAAGSNKTPLGLHRIKNKIGDGVPQNTIFKARRNTGIKAIINQPNSGDLVTSRIMWLTGLEPGKNSGRGVDSYRRYIYIHGTAEEEKIGEVASHGCIRMFNKDAIDLFDRVDEGTKVEIIR